MQGTNEKSNLTVLTAREHFLVHYILTRIYPDNPKIWYAFAAMCYLKNDNRYIPSSKIYEMLKIELNKFDKYNLGKTWEELFGLEKATQMKLEAAKRSQERECSEETREKCRLINLGRVRSDNTKKLIGAKSKGRFWSEKLKEWKRQQILGTKHSEKFCKDISIRQTGETNSSAKAIIHVESGKYFGCKKYALKEFGLSYEQLNKQINLGIFQIILKHE